MQLCNDFCHDIFMDNMSFIFWKYFKIKKKYVERLDHIIDKVYEEQKPNLSQMSKLEEIRLQIEDKLKICLKADFEVKFYGSSINGLSTLRPHLGIRRYR